MLYPTGQKGNVRTGADSDYTAQDDVPAYLFYTDHRVSEAAKYVFRGFDEGIDTDILTADSPEEEISRNESNDSENQGIDRYSGHY